MNNEQGDQTARDDDREVLEPFEIPSSDSDDEFIYGQNDKKQLEADMLSEYTDEDTLHSSGDEKIVTSNREKQNDPRRELLVVDAHKTLRQQEDIRLRQMMMSAASKADDEGADSKGWLYEVPIHAVSLNSSSCFILRPRLELRVMLYNIFSHWLFEVYLILVIISNVIFQANWTRSNPLFVRPPFATWVDTFYLVAYILEALLKVIALGLVLHTGAYLRNIWNWLDVAVIILGGLNLVSPENFGNYTSLRILRIILSFSLVKRPIGLRLFAKTFLRSARAVVHILLIVAFSLLFFGLIGLQLFAGSLHFRCGYEGGAGGSVTWVTPPELCRPQTTGRFGMYWGHRCADPSASCLYYAANPNLGMFHFDDIGHSLWTTFQVSTIQSWPSMLLMTNATVSMMSFLWYLCVIVISGWFIPSLTLGIFMERADKTRAEYVDARIKHYEDLCLSKRNETLRQTKISTDNPLIVEMDVAPSDQNQAAILFDGTGASAASRATTASSVRRGRTAMAVLPRRSSRDKGAVESTKQNAEWSEEKRLQLHLSLTRNKSIAEKAEVDRMSRKKFDSVSSRTPRNAKGEGAPSGSRPQSAAGRLDSAARELDFLDPSVPRAGSSMERVSSLPGSRPGSARPVSGLVQPSLHNGQLPAGSFDSLVDKHPTEAVGGRPMSGKSAPYTVDDMALKPAVSPTPNTPAQSSHHVEYVEKTVQDPEGGDLTSAKGCGEAWEIIRCIVHMFTEGFPRVISLYLYDVRKLKSKNGSMLDQLGHSSHEAQAKTAMDKLKSSNATLEDQEEHEEKLALSPYKMACDIEENAEATWFNYLMVVVLFVNSGFLASYHYPQSDQWTNAQWIAHFTSNLFYLMEVLLRITALGFPIYFSNVLNNVDVTVVTLGFIELGFNQTNAITCLRLYRLMSLMKKIRILRGLRKVSRVLFYSIGDLIYLSLFVALYMLLVVVYGMNLFGGRVVVGNALQSEEIMLDDMAYSTRGNFNTFSDAAYAVSQAFSRTRDDWLMITWSGMKVKGDYTVIYFVLAVMLALYVFQTMFVAILVEGFENDDERDSDDEEGTSNGVNGTKRFFDFRLWGKLVRSSGGFARRRVAPDEVFQLRIDMQRRLATARHSSDKRVITTGGVCVLTAAAPNPADVNYAVAVGNKAATPLIIDTQAAVSKDSAMVARPNSSSFKSAEIRNALPVTDTTQQRIVSTSNTTTEATGSGTIVTTVVTQEVTLRRRPSAFYSQHQPVPVSAVLLQSHAKQSSTSEERVSRRSIVQVQQRPRHVLLSGPTIRLAKIRVGSRWELDRCDECAAYKQLPLKPPARVTRRTPDELHAEQCEACALRMSRQHILNTIIQYVRLQVSLGVPPTVQCLETLLGQAWSCGMMLSETIEGLSKPDPNTDRRTWQWLLDALEVQQWILNLQVGEEQIGRASNAYLMAYKRQQVEEMDDTSPRSLFLFSTTNCLRSLCLDITSSRWFQWVMLAVIVAASICLAIYDTQGQRDSARNATLIILDDIFSVIFAVEVALKWIAWGVVHPYPTAYMYSKLNVFDLFIAIISLASMAIDSLGLRYLKALRVFHLLRLMQNFSWSKSVRIITFAIDNATQGFLSVGFFAALNYFVWTVFALHIFAGKTYVCTDANVTTHIGCNGTAYARVSITNQTNTTVTIINGTAHYNSSSLVTTVLQPYPRIWYSTSNRTFDTFDDSLLAMFEVSTGSWWLSILYQAVDSYSLDYASTLNKQRYLGLFFIAYYYVSSFIIFSLFSALMVYSYMKAKALMDGAAGLSFEQQVWLSVQSFLLKMRPAVLLYPLNNPLSKVLHRILITRGFDLLMSLIVVANIISMSADRWGYTERHRQVQQIQYVWVAMFILETVLRLIAHGLRTLRNGDHAFDALVVCLSILQIGLDTTENNRIPFNVNVLRMLRIFRVIHSVRFIPQVRRLRIYGRTLTASITSLISISIVGAMCVYVFAIAGMHAFGGIPNGAYVGLQFSNFDTFLNSLLATFRVITFESWNKFMRDFLHRGTSCSYGNCGTNWSPLFFVAVLLFVGILVVSCFAAVIVENYITTLNMETSIKHLAEVYRFVDIWQEYDPDATMLTSTSNLHFILRRLRPPLGVVNQWDRTEMTNLCREYRIPDHMGTVHFHEVLIPLARRTMARKLTEEEVNEHDTLWKSAETSLNALPVVRHRSTTATAELHFASSFVGAAYRRWKAMHAVHAMRRERWEEGRKYCDTVGLPYSSYGFGSIRLEDPFPDQMPVPLFLRDQQDATLKGRPLPMAPAVLSIGAITTVAESPVVGGKPPIGPNSRPTSATRAASPSPQPASGPRKSTIPDDVRNGGSRPRQQSVDSVVQGSEFQLPGQYKSALEETHTRSFGPDTPSAIQRGERRSDKLLKKYGGTTAESGVGATEAAEYQAPLGTQPEEWRDREVSRRRQLSSAREQQ